MVWYSMACPLAYKVTKLYDMRYDMVYGIIYMLYAIVWYSTVQYSIVQYDVSFDFCFKNNLLKFILT